MNNNVERKVGEIFEDNDQKLKVVETEDLSSCQGCYFLHLINKCYQNPCLLHLRKDRKNVVFQSI